MLATLNGQNKTTYTGYYDNGDSRIRVTVSDKFKTVEDIGRMLIQGHDADQLYQTDTDNHPALESHCNHQDDNYNNHGFYQIQGYPDCYYRFPSYIHVSRYGRSLHARLVYCVGGLPAA